MDCRIQRSQQWAARCVHEAMCHERNSFLTLTYANVPPGGSLVKSDLQKFWRRLRKDPEIGPVRYFACGEYGDANLRPHYHAILFGEDFGKDRIFWKKPKHGGNLYVSAKLSKLWTHGFATLGAVTFETAAYVARYVMKKVTGPDAEREYSRVDTATGEVHQVTPPYVTMSRRPGIGTPWLEKFSSDVFPSDEVRLEGRRIRPPRFYDQYLERKDPAFLEAVKAKRAKAVAKRKEDLTPERLKAREKHVEARLSLLQRPV